MSYAYEVVAPLSVLVCSSPVGAQVKVALPWVTMRSRASYVASTSPSSFRAAMRLPFASKSYASIRRPSS